MAVRNIEGIANRPGKSKLHDTVGLARKLKLAILIADVFHAKHRYGNAVGTHR